MSEDGYKQYANTTYEPATPVLDAFARKSDSTKIFRITKQDLSLFF